jgi:hypothetical protein
VAFWPSKGATVATDSTGVGPPIPSRRITIAATVNLLAEKGGVAHISLKQSCSLPE